MKRRLAAGVLAGTALCALPASALAASGAPGVSRLSGVLHLSAGRCAGGHPSGSYLSVTFGTRAVTNSASSCEGGAITLLSPGRDGLSTTGFSPASDQAFDSRGNAVAASITRPVAFGSHLLSLVSSGQDLQDAPTGPATFALPHLYVTGSRVLADVRSVQVLYDGAAGSTCASGAGSGCWLIGAQRATGTYDARTRHLTLSWFSGQSFVRQSAGTAVHLSGVFEGAPKTVRQGQAVELGTASFAAGPPTSPVSRSRGSSRGRAGTAAAQPGAVRGDIDEPHTTPLTQVVRAPAALAAAALLVGVDALLLAVAAGRRRS